MENPTQKIHDLLVKFDTAMLVTEGRDFMDNARPMAIAKLEDNCDVWLVASRSSEKVYEILHDSRVLLAFQRDHSLYLSVSGRGHLVTDKAKIRELWKESYKSWFPGGMEDPDVIVIHVIVEDAEFWDSTGWKGIRYLLKAAKAYVTGEPPKVDPDQHDRVALK
jgi:general stress protein 26